MKSVTKWCDPDSLTPKCLVTVITTPLSAWAGQFLRHMHSDYAYMHMANPVNLNLMCQCFDAVGWAAGRASGL